MKTLFTLSFACITFFIYSQTEITRVELANEVRYEFQSEKDLSNLNFTKFKTRLINNYDGLEDIQLGANNQITLFLDLSTEQLFDLDSLIFHFFIDEYYFVN